MFIEFGIWSNHLLILLLYPAFYQLKVFLIHKSDSALYEVFKNFLSYTFAGIFYLFVLCRTKTTNKEKEISKKETKIKNQIAVKKSTLKKERKKKQITSLFLLTLINILPVVIEIFCRKYIYFTFNESISSISKLLFFCIFSNVILKIEIYKHQLISLIIITLSLIGILFIEIMHFKNNIEYLKTIFSVIYFIIIYGFYSLFDVLVKRHFNIYFDFPYHLMFFVGIFSILLITPYELITYFFFNEKNFAIGGIIKEMINRFTESKINILWFFFDILNGFFWLAGIMLILYYFTPCHFFVSDALSHLLTTCLHWILGHKEFDWQPKWIYITIYSVIFLFSLIYNEIIIINVAPMRKNTIKYIRKRQRSEVEDTQNIFDENCDDNKILSKNRKFSEDEEV